MQLIYVDLLQSHLVKIPQGYPRIKFVSSAVLEQIDHTGKKKTQDHCKLFESLQFRYTIRSYLGYGCFMASDLITKLTRNIPKISKLRRNQLILEPEENQWPRRERENLTHQSTHTLPQELEEKQWRRREREYGWGGKTRRNCR